MVRASTAIVLFIAAGHASAQSLPELPDSSTIRVWAPEVDLKSERATFLGWQTSSLAAIHDETGDTLNLAFPDVTRLDLLRGKNVGLGVLRGGAIGGSIGGLIGLLAGSVAVQGCQGLFCEFDAFGYMLVGTGIGILPGMAIGANVPPDRWVRQSLPPEMGFPETGPDRGLMLSLAGLVLLTVVLSAS